MAAYLDSNATTQPAPEVVAAMLEMLERDWHNPSSIHRLGQAARRRVELARQSIARLLGCSPTEIIFTSGSTESIDLAFRGILSVSPTKRTLITTAIEHEAIRDLTRALGEETDGRIITRIAPLTPEGIVDLKSFAALLDDTVALVSIQWANNETGAIHPIEEIGTLCRERKIPFHTDATQWVGKMPTTLASQPIDLLSFSGHKFHAAKGTGGLFVRRGTRLRPVLRGSQERERRGGTENTPGIVGMGIAAEIAASWLADPAARNRCAQLRDKFEHAILAAVPDASVNGPTDPARRVWNTSNIAFPKLEAEALLLLLSEKGICASAGAACGSGSLDPSPVLLAMGISADRAHGSLRFSLSRYTTEAEIDEAIRIVPTCVAKLRESATSVV